MKTILIELVLTVALTVGVTAQGASEPEVRRFVGVIAGINNTGHTIMVQSGATSRMFFFNEQTRFEGEPGGKMRSAVGDFRTDDPVEVSYRMNDDGTFVAVVVKSSTPRAPGAAP